MTDELPPTHPDQDELRRFVHGELPQDEQARVEQHVAACDSCCDVLRSLPPAPLVARIQETDTAPRRVDENTRSNRSQPSQNVANVSPHLADHARYRIMKRLGEGGMGIVYLAEHRLMERLVAIKVINARFIDSDVAVERFRLEVKAAARLAHRNIVAAYDAEQAGDVHFLVMEFIEGKNLSEVVRKRGSLSVLHACNYVMQAAQGLQHAFEQGMIHRDIKPQNLMRTSKGTVKILDFGLARFASQHLAEADGGLTGESTLGTPDYIAPEQARNASEAGIQADIYSLGCTLYFLLAGHPPFPTGTVLEKVTAHCQTQPTPVDQLRPDVPPEVVAILNRMMAKEPEQRFQTPAEVVEALKPFGKPDDGTARSFDSTRNDAAATLQPLEALDLLAIDADQVERQVPSATRVRTGRRQHSRLAWGHWSRRNKRLLGAGAGGLLLLVVLFIVWPRLRDFAGIPQPAPSLTDAPDGGGPSEGGQSGDQRNEGWLDLIGPIELREAAVAGSWRKEDGELTVEAASNARLVLPYTPPAEYDFEVSFTRLTGSDSIALHFVAGQGQASFDIDAWHEHLVGIQNVEGIPLNDRPSRATRLELVNGRRYTALVRVRRGGVEALIDGQTIARYEGDGSDLDMLELWRLPSDRVLGIGAYESTTTFHRIRVRSAR